ncbi:MAG: hypothetical protein M4D80_06750 [Myxococcota bacterium]|nr:hypothetical protein [Myxococcota bacterium]
MVGRTLFLLLLFACELPDPKLVFAISDDPAQSCGSTNCADIQVPCPSVVSIRVLRPGEPQTILSLCEELPQNRNKDLCALASIDLSDKPIKLPRETLEVQIVIWPRDAVETEPDSGVFDCAKYEVKFDAVYGFPISQQPAPAIGGHTYYHPGDDEIRVTLGCTNLDAVNSCSLSTDLEVTATVESFENLGVLVSVFDGSQLTVSVGEPSLAGADTVHSLKGEDARALAMTVEGFVPIWKSSVDLTFNEVACVQVLEDSAQATTSVKCSRDNIPPMNNMLGLRGISLPKATLDQILAALPLAQFPANGMTVGIVVDSLFNPVAGQVVSAPGATIRYLNASRTSFNGTSTSASGVFVSLDAEFKTRFSVPGAPEEIGGRIQDKVTVVVIKK